MKESSDLETLHLMVLLPFRTFEIRGPFIFPSPLRSKVVLPLTAFQNPWPCYRSQPFKIHGPVTLPPPL